ncbi:MAG: iron-containing alcohol dehydrogenase [Anaerolineales bacterium]|nr:iron-containing alcohol dehydrogenase [Anaerolineales bacterium]
MWHFSSPQIVFGPDALTHLAQLAGRQAFVVTDPTLLRLGPVERVQEQLAAASIPAEVFAEVEPDPCLETVRRCAAAMTAAGPDWIIGLGGGSCLDVSKAAWLLYERPDVDPAAINPFDTFGLRRRARLIAIPTTSGTGSEATWAVVLTDCAAGRKLALGARELQPDLAIVDPSLVKSLPAGLTADTGLDALTHAIEGYACTWHNDFADGLCLKAIQLIFEYLPRAYADGADETAREHMHNAATIAGLGFGNSMTALAHAMGHALGAHFHVPHGRAVSLCLPYTMQFAAQPGGSRYHEIARFLHLPAAGEQEGAASLISAVRALRASLAEPASIAGFGVGAGDFRAALPALVADAELDTDIVTSARVPTSAELRRLFEYAYAGRDVDF